MIVPSLRVDCGTGRWSFGALRARKKILAVWRGISGATTKARQRSQKPVSIAAWRSSVCVITSGLTQASTPHLGHPMGGAREVGIHAKACPADRQNGHVGECPQRGQWTPQHSQPGPWWASTQDVGQDTVTSRENGSQDAPNIQIAQGLCVTWRRGFFRLLRA
jgi:hypothetical protein